MKIKWTNKESKETGYVKVIHKKEGYFENTYDIKEAKIFSKGTVEKAVEQLMTTTPQNDYEIV